MRSEGQGYRTDERGYRYDAEGYLIDERGYRVVQPGMRRDSQGYWIDGRGNRYDAEGFWVDERGIRHDYQDPPRTYAVPPMQPNRSNSSVNFGKTASLLVVLNAINNGLLICFNNTGKRLPNTKKPIKIINAHKQAIPIAKYEK